MGLFAPWRKALCPFCFNRFHLSKARQRQILHTAPTEPDAVVGEFLSISPPELGSVKSSTGQRLSKSFFAAGDWQGDTRSICPYCHMFLPHATATGQLSSDIVAIIGARGSGKSNYFGVLLKLLETRYADEVGFTIYDQETFSIREMKPVSTKRLYRERYGRLFDPTSRMAVDQNRSAAQDRDLRIPLIYRLEFPKRLRHYLTRPFSSRVPMDFVIFDAAGEDMEDPVAIEQFCRFILAAAGIIFIIDPLQLPGIRQRLDSSILRRFPELSVQPTEVVSRVINLFEARGRLKVGQKIRVPAAFVFSKCDILKGIVHAGSSIRRDSRHAGGFDEQGCKQLSDEVVACIREWDGPQLVNLAQGKFRTSAFFAMSALGQLPDENLNIRAVSPLRVADPLLWLLWKRKYISSADTRLGGQALR